MKLKLLIILTLFSYVTLFSQVVTTELIDMSEVVPRLKTNVKYATKDNFTGQKLYTIGKAFGTIPVANALKVINDSLSKDGLGLMVFDAYRPRAIQWFLWDIYPDPNFVADPRSGSRHNRGAAVDLTLYDIETGEELAMPTPFDDFSPQAGQNYQDLPEDVKRNRQMLRDVMTRNGFQIITSEWWHYDHTGSIDYPLKEAQMR